MSMGSMDSNSMGTLTNTNPDQTNDSTPIRDNGDPIIDTNSKSDSEGMSIVFYNTTHPFLRFFWLRTWTLHMHDWYLYLIIFSFIGSILTELQIHKDPELWPEISEIVRKKCMILGPDFFHNKDNDFPASVRNYKNQKRFLSSQLFVRTLINGEKHDRWWLMYSHSTGNVFCFVCKLFNNDSTSTSFTKDGFSNWKKSEKKVRSHENSPDHQHCLMKWIYRSNNEKRIDSYLLEQI